MLIFPSCIFPPSFLISRESLREPRMEKAEADKSSQVEFAVMSCALERRMLNASPCLEIMSPQFATSACSYRLSLLVARTCNLLLIVLDVLKPLGHKKLIEHELEGFGIRLNKQPPNIGFKKKDKGGINFTATVSLRHHGFLVKGCDVRIKSTSSLSA